MKNPFRILLFVTLSLALVMLLGSCSNYRYYNRYPKPRKCDCPSFSQRTTIQLPS
ncbi:MAG TPA: hypothetical protein PKJ28_05270 [Bacteroidales bacterium]|nr:hypothetical protein [Bacteroidales bacterium]HPS73018.1 hypothetical protein [Bacteroidales bacterium]